MKLRTSALAGVVAALALGCGGTDAATGTSGAAGGGASGGSAGAGGSGGSGGSAGATPCTIAPPAKPTWCGLPLPTPKNLSVPAGFCIRAFTEPGKPASPRSLRFAPNGDLFVAAPAVASPGGANGGLGAVLVLPDDDHDGKADAVHVFHGAAKGPSGKSCVDLDADPSNLECVHGLAVTEDAVWFTKWNQVVRAGYTAGDREAKQGTTVAATLGMPLSDVYRYTHTLDRAKDGRMLVSRGRFEAACDGTDAEMSKGAILAFLPGAPVADASVVSDGFRNPMYLRCHPSGTCLANELSGDGWIGLGQESIFVVEEGVRLGYPCCYKKGSPAPGGTAAQCAKVPEVAAAFPISHTPFGLAWSPASWPCGWGASLFVAKHGQVGTWNAANVVAFPTDGNGIPVGTERPFTQGFGQGGLAANARPADVAFSPDGRLFIAQDQDIEQGGRIYWVAPESLELP